MFWSTDGQSGSCTRKGQEGHNPFEEATCHRRSVEFWSPQTPYLWSLVRTLLREADYVNLDCSRLADDLLMVGGSAGSPFGASAAPPYKRRIRRLIFSFRLFQAEKVDTAGLISGKNPAIIYASAT